MKKRKHFRGQTEQLFVLEVCLRMVRANVCTRAPSPDRGVGRLIVGVGVALVVLREVGAKLEACELRRSKSSSSLPFHQLMNPILTSGEPGFDSFGIALALMCPSRNTERVGVDLQPTHAPSRIHRRRSLAVPQPSSLVTVAGCNVAPRSLAHPPPHDPPFRQSGILQQEVCR